MAATSPDPTKTYPIFGIAEKYWALDKHDCSKFVRDVANELGISLTGDANSLTDYWNGNGQWMKLGNNDSLASATAERGYFVVAGRKDTPHGHVVVIVPGRSNGHAMGYWGQLNGVGERDTSLSRSFKKADLAEVQYFAYPSPGLAAQ